MILTGAVPGTAAYYWGRVAGPGGGTYGGNQDRTVRGQTPHSCRSGGSEGVRWSHSDGQWEAFTDLHGKDQTSSQSLTGKEEALVFQMRFLPFYSLIIAQGIQLLHNGGKLHRRNKFL